MHFPRYRPSRQLVRLICLMFLISCIFPSSLTAQIQLPEIGDPAGNLITPIEEARLGKAFMRSIRSSMTIIPDPLLTAYIQMLGAKLTSNRHAFGMGFNFFLIKDPQINAFAGPGGNIGVYTGLITTTESESELASVIAHEVAHVTQRHLVRTYDAVRSMSVPAAAVAIAAIIIGIAAKSPDAVAAATTGIQAGLLQRQINFTRAHEEEADRIGIQILAEAGFDPRAMPTFFSRMGKTSRLYDNGKLPEFLRTHPVTSNRMADAYGRTDRFPYRQRADSLDYHLIRATLRADEFTSAQQGVAFFRTSLNEGRYRNEAAQRYGYVLALTANREYPKAFRELAKLLQKRPEQIEFIVARANLERLSGHPTKGLTILKEGLTLYPGNYPLTIYYAQALLAQGEATKAIQLLEQQLPGRPAEPTLYRLLAQASGNAGKKTDGRRYLAEYHYTTGDLKSATRQLEMALDDRNLEYYQSAKLAARLKEIRQELSTIEGHKAK
jgi:predicted Zn-dependent protease